jgi:cbb3-type cytochrome oxidase subunit 1
MLSRILLKLSVVYFVLAIVLGNYMGIQQDFRWKHVHVHIAVLGWLSLAVVGLMYRAYPELEHGWLPRAHLWLHNVGLVVFMGAFSYFVATGEHVVAPIGIGAMSLSLGIVLLAANVIVRLRPQRGA